MRIVVASTIVPYLDGGGRMVPRWLAQALREHGHSVEQVDIPFHSHWPEMLSQMLAIRLIDVSGSADRLIAVRSPSYLLKHRRKLVWFISGHRGAYDLWGTPYQDIPDSVDGRRVREAVIRADDTSLREATRVYAISRNVAQRLERFNGIEAEVLYPPLLEPERYRSGEFGDYLFYPSRIAANKRQELAVEAMRHVRSGLRLVVAGHADTPPQLSRLREAVARHGVGARVEIIGRWISEEEKTELMANALGCLFVPYDEDYGYVTLESFLARKPLVTCTDSGAPLEFVEDGVSGYVVPPVASELAGAMDRLMANRERARAMGAAGYERLRSLDISWRRVVEALTR